jgi:hypothetical protein
VIISRSKLTQTCKAGQSQVKNYCLIFKIATIFLSAQVEIKFMFVLSKKRSIVLTNDKIYVLNKKDTQPRYIHDYSDVLGITISLLVGAKNMILHLAT